MKLVEGTRADLYDTESLKSCREGKIVRLIHPSKIAYCPKVDFDPGAWDEKVADGDWDQGLELFEDGLVFRSFEEVFVGGKEWKLTDYWRMASRA